MPVRPKISRRRLSKRKDRQSLCTSAQPIIFKAMKLRFAISIVIAALTSTLLAEPELSPTPPTIQIPAKSKKLKGAVAIFAPKPDYPEYARAHHWVGAGWYVMNVDTDTGLVTSVEITQSAGHRILDRAAVNAFRRWRFQPGRMSRAKCPVTWKMSVQPDTYLRL